MEFTGERFIPGAVEPNHEMRVEHLHRYSAVQHLAAGKVVLDAACGEGYGSALLADVAAQVHGIDVSHDAVAHAHSTYRSATLDFRQASVASLPFGDATFDLVVSFETIEHVDGPTQEKFLDEIRRVLKPDGLLLISTPDKLIYTDSPGAHNEFHVKEFYREDFRSFLSRAFPWVEFFDQRYTLSSLIRRDSTEDIRLMSLGGDRPRPPGKYIVAACAATPTRVELSSFIDDEFGFLADKVRHIANLERIVEELRDGLQLARDQLRLKEVHAVNLEKQLAEITPALDDARRENRLKVNHFDNLRRFNSELREEQKRLQHLLDLKDNHIRNLEALTQKAKGPVAAAPQRTDIKRAR